MSDWFLLSYGPRCGDCARKHDVNSFIVCSVEIIFASHIVDEKKRLVLFLRRQ